MTADDLHEAWAVMLRVFHQFDPQERDKVTPRDFCLAVSVLIDGGGVR